MNCTICDKWVPYLQLCALMCKLANSISQRYSPQIVSFKTPFVKINCRRYLKFSSPLDSKIWKQSTMLKVDTVDSRLSAIGLSALPIIRHRFVRPPDYPPSVYPPSRLPAISLFAFWIIHSVNLRQQGMSQTVRGMSKRVRYESDSLWYDCLTQV